MCAGAGCGLIASNAQKSALKLALARSVMCNSNPDQHVNGAAIHSLRLSARFKTIHRLSERCTKIASKTQKVAIFPCLQQIA